MSTDPAWGTPPAPSTSGTARQRPLEPGAPGYQQQVRWQNTPAGMSPHPMDTALIRRQATVALVVNLLVLCFALGFMSAPGAAMALRARTLAPLDPVRARRSLSWSWILLASNLLLYLLIVVLVVSLFFSLIF